MHLFTWEWLVEQFFQAAMAEVEQSTSKVSYVLYRDGDPSHGSEENSADSDSASYYSSASEDETTEKQVQMKSFANGNSSAKRIPKWLRPEGRKLKMLEITLMTIAIVIVLGIYSLPVSFYINESSPEQEQQTVNSSTVIHDLKHVRIETHAGIRRKHVRLETYADMRSRVRTHMHQ